MKSNLRRGHIRILSAHHAKQALTRPLLNPDRQKSDHTLHR